MKIRDYLKDKIPYLLCHGGVLAVTVLVLPVALPGSGWALAAMIGILYLMGAVVPLCYEYHKKRQFYDNLLGIFDRLDRKNLLAEMIEAPSFFEGGLLYDILKRSNKAYLDEIGRYKFLQEEYRGYIEMWVHEIKTPIASIRLTAQNAGGPVMESIAEDDERIEGYVQQALYYSRSSSVEKDYLIKEVSLQELCFSALRKNARIFIQNKISTATEDLDLTVYCDEKWVGYILDQLIANAVKYTAGKEGAWVRFDAVKWENAVALTLSDNGVGIPAADLPRIFDKGFTGQNGRLFEKSTGMGLYICKKLCDKMGLSITARSEQGKGTSVTIVFPKNSMIDLN